jgi:hypothetical protein
LPHCRQAAAIKLEKLSLASFSFKQNNHVTGKGKSLFKGNQGIKLVQGLILAERQNTFAGNTLLCRIIDKKPACQ